jgi:hypothetical protein
VPLSNRLLRRRLFPNGDGGRVSRNDIGHEKGQHDLESYRQGKRPVPQAITTVDALSNFKPHRDLGIGRNQTP